MTTPIEPKLRDAADTLRKLKAAVATAVVGQNEVVDEVVFAIVAGGHALLEGAPGLGKTLLVRSLAASFDLQYSRIQFTPDLMPSDVTGTNVLVLDPEARTKGSAFSLERGPIFGNVVLADEINRATPKTQSALLEAMAEHAVTIAGIRHALPDPFFVLATENPIEMEGTYPLPEAQLDRFLFKVLVPNPTEDELCEVLARTTGRDVATPPRVLGREGLLAIRALCRDVLVSDSVARYAARLVRASEPTSPDAPAIVKRGIRFGAGVRGAQSLVLGAKAVALSEARGHIGFADIARVALPALRHRLVRSFEAEADGVTTDAIVEALLREIPERPKSVTAEVRS
jgi:MoxR-like ATPase